MRCFSFAGASPVSYRPAEPRLGSEGMSLSFANYHASILGVRARDCKTRSSVRVPKTPPLRVKCFLGDDAGISAHDFWPER